MKQRFSSPKYNVTLLDRTKVAIDVTNSISAGLEPNHGLIETLVPWMKDRGYQKILDFGAGALRHTIPLLKEGFELISVEFESAYSRPKARDARAQGLEELGVLGSRVVCGRTSGAGSFDGTAKGEPGAAAPAAWDCKGSL